MNPTLTNKRIGLTGARDDGIGQQLILRSGNLIIHSTPRTISPYIFPFLETSTDDSEEQPFSANDLRAQDFHTCR